ncbi:AC4 [Tomato yellow leaf curl Kanchanaburi virus]|uniref:AC4 n=2 Tax=Tomato yellow leaf curl Kanchanaburi virus TaxID=266799 RepID=U5YSC4_9GEMI|nr:AC4 [Tomato yellow leaf curl Kanchanaburi virus]AAO15926.1 AC4 [Tomato yellow leaf curl Kanchanaburi virus-[Thailand Kan1]]AGZ95259.1 AC4 [Tomato yellow leaf curl Kanchanaburi virus]AGZ95265.1 AC4 [Tomato yellow leaf curl Kanchanaburi virus]AGZ95271.1 AC4 [Tomato yellow leaf curl Kanchanaburi virus]AGZ95277.1 AC4 [Tomato yellow leaf curl Kanchanaburi virus]
MGALISMCSFNSKGNSSAKITDSSTWFPQPDQHISIQMFRELNQAPTSSPIWRRTEIQLNGENSRLMEDLLEADNNPPMTHTQRQLTAEVSRRLLQSLRN